MRKSGLIAAVVTVGLTGCGGSSGPSLSAFKSGFTTDKTSFHQLGLDLQQAITTARGKTDSQLATEIGALATRAKSQADSLAKLNPPRKYKAELQKLVSGFRMVGSDLSNITTAAIKHDATSARTDTEKLITDAAVVKSADTTISSELKLPTQ